MAAPQIADHLFEAQVVTRKDRDETPDAVRGDPKVGVSADARAILPAQTVRG